MRHRDGCAGRNGSTHLSPLWTYRRSLLEQRLKEVQELSHLCRMRKKELEGSVGDVWRVLSSKEECCVFVPLALDKVKRRTSHLTDG